MSKFEDRLFDELLREHGGDLAEVQVHRPAAPRRVPRPVWVAAGAVVVATAVGVGVGVVGTGTPAYAVDRGSDGTITISLRSISGVAGANAELRKLGVPVVAVPMRKDCTATLVPDDRVSLHRPVSGSVQGSGRSGSATVSVDVRDIPAGDTMIIAAQERSGGVALGIGITRGPAPKCLSLGSVPGQVGGTEHPGQTRDSDSVHPAESGTSIGG